MLPDAFWQPIAFWMRDTSLSAWVNGTSWVFPTAEDQRAIGTPFVG